MRGESNTASFQRHLDELRNKVAGLEEQVRDVHGRIERLHPVRQRARRAVVNRLRCTGCGMCGEICPYDAVRVNYLAVVDAQRCTGCGLCVQNCPQGAIRLIGEGQEASENARKPESA